MKPRTLIPPGLTAACLWLAWLALFLLPPALRAQNFTFTPDATPLADLSHAQWRFHPGDDPRFSGPSFDDSSWQVVSGDQSWDATGHRHLAGFGWYRIHIHLTGPPRRLTFAPGEIENTYQVFANGHPVGSWSTPSANFPNPHYGWSVVIPLGQVAGDLVLALRVHHSAISATYHDGGFNGTRILLGSPADVHTAVAFSFDHAMLNTMPEMAIALLCLAASVVSFLLYLRERSAPEYLWFGILAFCFIPSNVLSFLAEFCFVDSLDLQDLFTTGFQELGRVAVILLFLRFIKVPVPRPVRWFIAAVGVLVIFDVLETFIFFAGVTAWNLVGFATDAVAYLIASLLVLSWWKRSRAARQFALPLFLLALGNFWTDTVWVFYTLDRWPARLFYFVEQPIMLQYIDLAQLVFVATMAWVLIDRFSENQHERTRLAGEFQAAREVQQVLVPSERESDALPEVPGLAIHTVYRPAQMVGGDFFQVIPAAAGAVLVVLGDVSGKGLQAAMTVSLLVGALRTVVEITLSPALILEALNRRLAGRNTGFTTCLVLHLAPDGDATVASAGHLNPYLAGRELPLEPGLPLGFLPHSTYSEVHFHLPPAELLTLVTDGVPEAMGPHRELFGFERTAAVSRQPAGSIAEAVANFVHRCPQSDDLTILTLERA